MIKFIYETDDLEFYTPIEVKVDLPDDCNLEDMWVAFKSFMYAQGYRYIEDYDLIKKQDITDMEIGLQILGKENRDLMEKLDILTQPKVMMDNPREDEDELMNELDDFDDEDDFVEEHFIDQDESEMMDEYLEDEFIDEHDEEADGEDDGIEIAENDGEHQEYDDDEFDNSNPATPLIKEEPKHEGHNETGWSDYGVEEKFQNKSPKKRTSPTIPTVVND